MKPIIVLGATGKVGKHVVNELAGKSVPVLAITRDATMARELMASEDLNTNCVEFVEIDVADSTAIRSVAHGCGQAYVATVDTPDQVHIEVEAVREFVDLGVGHIVKISSCDAALDAAFHGRAGMQLSKMRSPQ